jgi:hypothetical protein
MKGVQVPAGYRFEGIETEERIEVEWSLDGESCPTILLDFGPCVRPPATPTLHVRVPADLLARCPGLASAVDELSSAVRGEQPADISKPPTEWSPPPAVWPKVVAAVAFAGLALIRYLQAPGLEGVLGWRCGLQLLFALVAANVLFLGDRNVVDTELIAFWLGFAVLLIERDRWARATRLAKGLVVGLFAFSLIVHWAFSHGGPGDAHLNLYALWSPDIDRTWGQGPIALLRIVAVMTGTLRDTHIVWCNLILSSLVPIVLCGIVSELGLGRVAAITAAFIAAAHPLLIVFSSVLERQPMYLFAACGSLLALIRFLERDDWRRFVAVVLGTILAITCRPEGAHVVVLQCAVVLLLPATRRARGVAMLTVGLLGALGFVYAQRFGHAGTALSRTFATLIDPAPLRWTVLLDPDFTPAAWIAMWMLGVLLGLRDRAGWIVVMILLGLNVLWQWTGLYEMFVNVERQVASSRYETILLIPFTIGIACFIRHLAALRGTAQAGVILIVLTGTILTFGRTYDVLLKPFTIDYEYQFLKHHALTLPPRSHVWVFVSPDPDQGFYDANWVGSSLRARWNSATGRMKCRTAATSSAPDPNTICTLARPVPRSSRRDASRHRSTRRGCGIAHASAAGSLLSRCRKSMCRPASSPGGNLRIRRCVWVSIGSATRPSATCGVGGEHLHRRCERCCNRWIKQATAQRNDA